MFFVCVCVVEELISTVIAVGKPGPGKLCELEESRFGEIMAL